jgi:hypothetical protein
MGCSDRLRHAHARPELGPSPLSSAEMEANLNQTKLASAKIRGPKRKSASRQAHIERVKIPRGADE